MKQVSQRVYFKNWSFIIRDVTRYNVSYSLSRNLSRSWDLILNSEFLLAAQEKCCETGYKRDVTLCNGYKMRCSVAVIVAKSRT